MNTYKYSPYYKFNGPEAGNPLREEISEEDQQRNIEQFYTDVMNFFEDEDAIIFRDASGAIIIQTDLTEKDCDRHIKSILNNLDLYAKKSCPKQGKNR